MFAKIYESEKIGQILITKEYNTEEDTSTVVITFEFQNMLIKTSIGVNTEEQQIELFDSMDLKKAEDTILEVVPFDI